MAVQVAQLFIYPVKSCRGIEVGEAAVTARGFRYDRRYMLVDKAGQFITQRDLPRLSLVKTEIHGDRLRLSAPGSAAVDIELEPAPGRGESFTVQIWRDSQRAERHARGSAWFSALLGDEVELAYMPDDSQRPVNPARSREGDIVSFADGYPFLLIGRESLADLNARLASPIGIERFRPNIVTTGAEPYAEDDFREVEIGSVSFRGVKRCDRCSVTTVDPETGERGKEPMRTLARYRRQDGKVWFGMNLIHDGSGTLRVGDAVRALAPSE